LKAAHRAEQIDHIGIVDDLHAERTHRAPHPLIGTPLSRSQHFTVIRAQAKPIQFDLRDLPRRLQWHHARQP